MEWLYIILYMLIVAAGGYMYNLALKREEGLGALCFGALTLVFLILGGLAALGKLA